MRIKWSGIYANTTSYTFGPKVHYISYIPRKKYTTALHWLHSHIQHSSSRLEGRWRVVHTWSGEHSIQRFHFCSFHSRSGVGLPSRTTPNHQSTSDKARGQKRVSIAWGGKRMSLFVLTFGFAFVLALRYHLGCVVEKSFSFHT